MKKRNIKYIIMMGVMSVRLFGMDDRTNTVSFLSEMYQNMQDAPSLFQVKPHVQDKSDEIEQAESDTTISPYGLKEYTKRKKWPRRQGLTFASRMGEAISSAASDVFYLHVNLLSWNTFKVITSMFPVYVAARMIDEKLQKYFYDAVHHKNKNQLPNWCHTLAKVSIGVPIVLLGIDFLFSNDNDKRWTAQIMLLGMPFVIWTKKLIKQMKFDGCLRPWNENFDRKNRSWGGFPSGHMAQALYMAVLYGTRYGPLYAVPLGALATMIGVTFVSCNRHYISQIIAGGTFGSIYALAASALVEKKLTDSVKLGMKVDGEGRPTFTAAIKW